MTGLSRVGPVAVLVPVKAFDNAKVRLAPALPPAARSALARTMAEGVLRAARGATTAVACDDAAVGAWAMEKGAMVVWTPDLGLNGAVARGVDELGRLGAERVIVAHADLPLADDLRWAGRFAGVTLVPDRRDDGTNVLCVPVATGFEFHYGPGSFRRHQIEARRRGLPLRIARVPDLAWDVDVPADLTFAAAPPP
jgi:2-phospho-L-lactate guanylyltransferase